ncbi:glutamate racemase [Polaromonas sp.]|uniref:glutamate racemase n=1 Tax=Polaromonas sp. TaxID=1869339 RepID=UPI00184EB566|nr:glutamate racemase [Polaromonas sp.]NMM06861.1 glutamate racemase [Polaromonas sp.]
MNAPIGVFDSGIGGLSVLKALRAELPLEDFIYIADSGHAPYGERDDAHVLARSRALTAHLVQKNVKAVVIACNTATAAAINQLRAEYPQLPIIGVEPALKPAALLSRTRRIGVMATRSTLASSRFKLLLDSLASQAEFVLQPCDGLADAIERGIKAQAGAESATEIIAACARNIRAMGQFGLENGEIDTLVLGCTHYPFAGDHLQALVGADVTLVETGEAVARQTQRLLRAAAGSIGPAVTGPGRISLLTTGDAYTLKAAAAHWLALHEPVDLLPTRSNSLHSTPSS